MESFFVRYRNLVVLLAVLVAQIIGLAVQVRRTDERAQHLDRRGRRGVRLIRLWADALVSPPERLIHASEDRRRRACGTNYIDLRHVREQNQDLQKTIDRLRLEQAALLEDAQQGQRLQALLDFQQKYIYKTLAAQVDRLQRQRSVARLLYRQGRGRRARSRDMAVITAGRHCGQGARCVSAHRAGAGHQRPDQRRGRDSGDDAHSRHSARQRGGPAADCGHPGRPAHSAGREGADRRGRPDFSARAAGGRGGEGGPRPGARRVYRRDREAGGAS